MSEGFSPTKSRRKRDSVRWLSFPAADAAFSKYRSVFDWADGEAVLAVEAVTVGVAESHGVTLFALVPFNGIFTPLRST